MSKRASPVSKRASPVSKMTTRDVLRILFRRKLALILPIVAGVILAGVLCRVLPPKHRAEALVKRQDLALLNSAPASLIARETSGVSINTLRVEILTSSNLDKVIRQLNLDSNLKSDAAWQDKYSELRSSITLETVAQTRGIDLVKISASSDSPVLAQLIANAIADNYVEESKRAGQKPTVETIAFMAKGAEDAQKEMRDVEVELDKFRQTRFEGVPEVKQRMLEQRFALHRDQTAKALQLSAAQSRLTEIEKQMKDVPPRISAPDEKETFAPSAARPPLATESAQQLKQLKQQLEVLLGNFTEDHPEVKKLKRAIAALEEPPAADSPHVERMIINPAFAQLVLDGLSVRQEIKGCEAALRHVQAEIGAIDDDLRKVVNEENRYTTLIRRQKELETTYSQYRQHQLAAEALHRATTDVKYGTQVEMIQRALTPAGINVTQLMKVPGACFFGGIAMGLVLVFLGEYTDQSLRNAHEANEFLNLPVLGKISVIPEPENVRKRRRMAWIAAAVIVTVLMAASVASVMGTVWPSSHFGGLVRLLGV